MTEKQLCVLRAVSKLPTEFTIKEVIAKAEVKLTFNYVYALFDNSVTHGIVNRVVEKKPGSDSYTYVSGKWCRGSEYSTYKIVTKGFTRR